MANRQPTTLKGDLLDRYSAAMNATARWLSVPVSTYLPAATYWFAVIVGNGATLYYDGSGSDYTSTLGATWFQSELGGGSAPTNSSRKYSIRGSLIQ